MSEQEKKEVIISDWSAGIVADVDRNDAPMNSLYDIRDAIVKEGYLKSIGLSNIHTDVTTATTTDPGKFHYMVSKYTPTLIVKDTEYLYFIDGTTLRRLYRDYGVGSFVEDTSFSVSGGSFSSSPAGFSNVGEYLFVYGLFALSGGVVIVSPYNYDVIDGAATKKGWSNTVESVDIVAAFTADSGAKTYLDTHTDSVAYSIVHSSTIPSGQKASAYKENDVAKYYMTTVDVNGYEATVDKGGGFSMSTAEQCITIKVFVKGTTIKDGIKKIRLYKRNATNGEQFLLTEIDINDGVIADATNNSYPFEADWTADGNYYYVGFNDMGIWTQPKGYVCDRYNNKDYDDAPIMAYATSYKGRVLGIPNSFGSSDQPIPSMYISSVNKPGDMYENTYIAFDAYNNKPIKSIQTWNNYIMVMFDNKSLILDATHPFPENWKVVAQTYGGAMSANSAMVTDFGIVFADATAIRLFDGTMHEVVNKYNIDYYRDYVSGASDISIMYDHMIDSFIIIANITQSPKALVFDRQGRMSTIKDVGFKDFGYDLDNKIVYLSNSMDIKKIEINNLLDYGLNEFLIQSNWITLGDSRDKILYKVIVRNSMNGYDSYLTTEGSNRINTENEYDIISSKAVSNQYTITVYNEDLDIIASSTGTMEDDVEIFVKSRFKKLKYIIESVGKLKEVSILVGARKQNRNE